MKIALVGIMLLMPLLFSGCATTSTVMTLKPRPEIGGILKSQEKVGVVGYPASVLENYNIKAVNVEKPVETNPIYMKSFLRERKIDSLITVETNTSSVEEGASTSSNDAEIVAKIAMNVAIAAAGGVVSPTTTQRTTSTAPAMTRYTQTCKVNVYGNDGNILMDETVKEVTYSKPMADEAFSGSILLMSLSLSRK